LTHDKKNIREILIVGAGKEGKGFLGQVFSSDGWKVSFLDKDPLVIANLEKGSYKVNCFGTDGTFPVIVAGYDVYRSLPDRKCLTAVLNADIIAFCLYPEDIPEAIEYLAPCIEERASSGGRKLTVLCCTNLNHSIKRFEGYFFEFMKPATQRWFLNNVAFRDTIVRRSVSAKSSDALELDALTVASLLIQKPINVNLSGVKWMELIDDLEKWKDIKLYTINAMHATCAYAGWLKGYSAIGEAERDPEIAGLMKDVLSEAVKGLSSHYDIREDEILKFSRLPQPMYAVPDYITRVAYDPIRKIAKGDRLTGNAMFCYEHGHPYSAIARSIANALAYVNENDPAASEIQAVLDKTGITSAVAKFCGINANHPVSESIVSAYAKIIQVKRVAETNFTL
jgi:mannitol-1-phosphate 5-dehydrogenase